MLKDVFDTAPRPRAVPSASRTRSRGKTGTTNTLSRRLADRLLAANPHAGLVGFDDAKSVRLAGGDACLPIWTRHITGSMAWTRRRLAPPDDVTSGRSIRNPATSPRRIARIRGPRFTSTEPSRNPYVLCTPAAAAVSPFWNESPCSSPPREPILDPADAQRRAELERRRARERVTRSRKLLRRIFGDD